MYDEMMTIKVYQTCELPHLESRGRTRFKRGLSMVHKLRGTNGEPPINLDHVYNPKQDILYPIFKVTPLVYDKRNTKWSKG